MNKKNNRLLTLLLLFGILLLFVLFVKSKYNLAIVASGSMESTINANDMIIIKKFPNYNIDDIITYNYKNSTVTHRVYKKIPGGYFTKGDANSVVDKVIIRQKDILGKVIFIIPKVGSVIAFIKKPMLILLIFGVLYYLCKKQRRKTTLGKQTNTSTGSITKFIAITLCFAIFLTISQTNASYLDKKAISNKAKVAKFDVQIIPPEELTQSLNTSSFFPSENQKDFVFKVENNSSVPVSISIYIDTDLEYQLEINELELDIRKQTVFTLTVFRPQQNRQYPVRLDYHIEQI